MKGESMTRKAIGGFVITAAATLLFAADPFSGFWRLNLAKSKLPPPLPRSQTSRINVDGDSIHIHEEIENDKGERMTITVEARFDGRDYPIHGTPFGDTVAYERIDPYTLMGKVKKSGRIISREKIVVSSDGATMTSTYSGIDATGREAAATAVFEKQ
jgi:hypothetical protein